MTTTRAFERVLPAESDFDLARTAAPVWWSGGRSPSTDWRNQTFYWVGSEDGGVVWRTARQDDQGVVLVSGSGDPALDETWGRLTLGLSAPLPEFDDDVLSSLLGFHKGYRPWGSGSLYLGFVSTIIGQSISLAAAATTEQRLFQRFSAGIELDGKRYWAPPAPTQLAAASLDLIRGSGVTTVRAGALKALASRFATAETRPSGPSETRAHPTAEELLEIKGIGPWTVQSALLWGVAAPDAHPTGDVALLRAARKHFPDVSDLRQLDRLAETWKPHRGWAARLLWLDLLGYPTP